MTETQKSAVKKLDKERETETGGYAQAIAEYIKTRCEDDKGMAEDVMRKNKNLKGCLGYINSKARGKAKNNVAVIKDELVYEWAEDYYRDNAGEAKKAKESVKTAEPKHEVSAAAAARMGNFEKKKKTEKKTDKNIIDGQLSLF